MTTLKWPARYGDEKLDYQVDWSKALAGDQIVRVTATTSSSDLIISDCATAEGVTTLWLEGGGPAQKRAQVHLVADTVGRRSISVSVWITILNLTQ